MVCQQVSNSLSMLYENACILEYLPVSASAADFGLFVAFNEENIDHMQKYLYFFYTVFFTSDIRAYVLINH